MIADGTGWRVLRLDDGSSVVVDPDDRVVAVTENGTGDAVVNAAPAPAETPAEPETAAVAESPAATETPAAPTAAIVPAPPPLVSATTAVTPAIAPSAIAVPAGLRSDAASLRFDTGTIGELASSLRGASDGIRNELDRLDATVAGLRAGWGGSAETAYRTAHREWDARLDALRVLLRDAAKLATHVRDTMEGTESRVRSLWD